MAHALFLLSVFVTFVIGIGICAVLLTPLLRRHFRWVDAHPRWYER